MARPNIKDVSERIQRLCRAVASEDNVSVQGSQSGGIYFSEATSAPVQEIDVDYDISPSPFTCFCACLVILFMHQVL